jgi:2-polyprenyl-3-methyl-5-hydroxy-6-metoxy-1,4-benzoquinol methylase
MIKEKNNTCYLCGSNSLKIIRNKVRYDIRRNVLKCSNCGFVYLEEKQINYDDYYKGDYRKLYTPNLGEKLTSKQLFESLLPYQKYRVEIAKDLVHNDSTICDIGCSSGHFLHSMKGIVKERIGIEFNQSDFEFVEQELKIKVFNEPIQKTNLKEKTFDLISSFHVLEHVEDPRDFLINARKYLKDSGYLLIEVPNVEDALLSLYRNQEYEDFWYREPHIYNFSIKSLNELMKQSGFVGESYTIQRYNIFNHFNWLMKGSPQSKMEDGMSEINIIDNSIKDELKNPFSEFFKKIDLDYKKLLNENNLGDSIVFIGKKTD